MARGRAASVRSMRHSPVLPDTGEKSRHEGWRQGISRGEYKVGLSPTPPQGATRSSRRYVVVCRDVALPPARDDT